MNGVFIDSSFWISYRAEENPRQREATQIMTRLYRERVRLVITLPIFCEVHATFSRNCDVRETILQDFSNNPLVLIEDIMPEDQQSAIKLLQANRDKTYSLCHALSFAVMRRLGIRRAVTFDRHFKQFGEFEIVS